MINKLWKSVFNTDTVDYFSSCVGLFILLNSIMNVIIVPSHFYTLKIYMERNTDISIWMGITEMCALWIVRNILGILSICHVSWGGSLAAWLMLKWDLIADKLLIPPGPNRMIDNLVSIIHLVLSNWRSEDDLLTVPSATGRGGVVIKYLFTLCTPSTPSKYIG